MRSAGVKVVGEEGWGEDLWWRLILLLRIVDKIAPISFKQRTELQSGEDWHWQRDRDKGTDEDKDKTTGNDKDKIKDERADRCTDLGFYYVGLPIFPTNKTTSETLFRVCSPERSVVPLIVVLLSEKTERESVAF